MTDSPANLPVAPPIDIVLSHRQLEVLVTTRIVVAFLSLFGSLFVVICMIKFRKFQGPQKLIMILTLCNMGDAISSLLSFGTFFHESDRSGLCYFQGICMQFFQVAAFCWAAIISINLWFVIVKRRLDVDNLHKYYHAAAWSVVAVCVLIPTFTKAYGPASGWCWISKNARGGNVLRFVSFFVPFYIAWVLILVLYFWTHRVAANSFQHMREDEREKSQRQIARLRAYPIIFVILYIPATVNRVYNWMSNDDIFFLYLLQVLTAPAVGFVNSIAYGMDTEIRNFVANSFIRRGWCSYCLGDVILQDPHGEPSGHASGSTHYDDEDIIEDGVIDERGAVRLSSPKASHRDRPVSLDSYPQSPTGASRTSHDEDTIAVDF